MEKNREHGFFGKLLRLIVSIALFCGFATVLGNWMDTVAKDLDKKNKDNLKKKYLAFMNGRLVKVKDEKFEVLEVDNFMGGVDVDVTRADFSDNACISVRSIMGGVTIKVPPMVHVVIEEKSILSGCANLVPEYEEKVKTLRIKVNALMSGVSVKMIP